jgi:hypothetical protein
VSDQQAPIVPSLPNGNGDGWRCTDAACTAGPHAQLPNRCAKGHVQPANTLARQTGLYARQQPAGLREALDTFTAALIADLGGASELTELERGYVQRLRSLELRARLLDADLDEHGLLTPSGGVRRAHGEFINTVRTWDQLAQRLGPKRRAKRVDLARALSGLERA